MWLNVIEYSYHQNSENQTLNDVNRLALLEEIDVKVELKYRNGREHISTSENSIKPHQSFKSTHYTRSLSWYIDRLTT